MSETTNYSVQGSDQGLVQSPSLFDRKWQQTYRNLESFYLSTALDKIPLLQRFQQALDYLGKCKDSNI